MNVALIELQRRRWRDVSLQDLLDRRTARSHHGVGKDRETTMEGGQDNGKNSALDQKTTGAVKLLVGRIASVLGILAGVGGTVAALAVQSTNITAGVAAGLLGAVGYFLGARRLGAVSVVVGVGLVVMLVGASTATVPPTITLSQ